MKDQSEKTCTCKIDDDSPPWDTTEDDNKALIEARDLQWLEELEDRGIFLIGSQVYAVLNSKKKQS